jgi:hypothetical protein
MGRTGSTHETRNEYSIWSEKGRVHLEGLSTHGRIILKWIWNRYVDRIHLLRTGTSGGLM